MKTQCVKNHVKKLDKISQKKQQRCTMKYKRPG